MPGNAQMHCLPYPGLLNAMHIPSPRYYPFGSVSDTINIKSVVVESYCTSATTIAYKSSGLSFKYSTFTIPIIKTTAEK